MLFPVRKRVIEQKYRKIPKISSVAYIFQRPFLRGLFLEGLINGGFFVLPVWGGGAYIWRGIYMERLIFGLLRYSVECARLPFNATIKQLFQ